MKSESIWDFVELMQRLKTEPELLDSGQFPPEFVTIVRPLIQTGVAKAQTIDDLMTEIQSLYQELNQFSPGIMAEDRETYTQYLKLKASLISKIVELKERTMNLRSIKVFQDRVLLAVDKVMNAEQRTEFMKVLDLKGAE